MLCTNCGARLMETDQFCPKCGTKAIKDIRCPDCGALMRGGVKFCPKCGRALGGSARKVSEDTLDIPIDAIERNILSETAAELRADQRPAPRKSTSAKSSSRSAEERSVSSRNSSRSAKERSVSSRSSSRSAEERSTSSKSSSARDSAGRSASDRSAPPRKRLPDPEPPRKKRVVYREEDWEDDDWEEDDWDDEDDDEGVDVITIMTAIVGCVLLVVVAVLGFHLFRQYVPKNYDRVAEEEQEEQEQQQEQTSQGQEPEDGGNQDALQGEDRETITLTVTHNVNVRDNPSTHGTNVIMVAQEGETYTSYGSVDGGEWYEILLEDGTTGYVFHEYISIE